MHDQVKSIELLSELDQVFVIYIQIFSSSVLPAVAVGVNKTALLFKKNKTGRAVVTLHVHTGKSVTCNPEPWVQQKLGKRTHKNWGNIHSSIF